MMAQVIRGVAGVRTRLGFLKTTSYIYTHYATPLQQQQQQRRLAHAHRAALKLPGQLKVERKEEEEEEKRRSRNDLKKQAHQAVRWGMELASFSIPQIKRILLAASLDKQVFEALLLVKKLGPDVREGKRRQFNYIGKLLRDAQPDLLSALIQATKDGDHSRFHSLAHSVPQQQLYDSGPDLEPPEDSGDHLPLATSWFDGFMNKDIQISNEVYSINSVEFDRQELRRLVRNVQYIQDCRKGDDQDSEETAALAAATNSLRCFLISLISEGRPILVDFLPGKLRPPSTWQSMKLVVVAESTPPTLNCPRPLCLAPAPAAAEYWCHHCDKRVSVESVPDQPDLICSDCKFGFVESINIHIPVIDEPTLGSQFLQVLRLLSQVSRDQPQPPSRASSDPDHRQHQDPQQDDDDDEEEDDDVDDDDDDDDEESVRSVEIRGDSGDDHDTEDDILRRQRRDLLRLRLRDFATRARPAGRNRILDWADILMGLDNNSTTDHLYVGNPGDYANDAEYHTLLQNLADAEGRRGAPPASKAAVHALNSLQLQDASFVCAICKEGLALGDSLKEMPCTHAYHAHCIVPWLAARNTCPVCRFELPTDDPDYEEDKRKTSPTTATSSSSSSSAPTS